MKKIINKVDFIKTNWHITDTNSGRYLDYRNCISSVNTTLSQKILSIFAYFVATYNHFVLFPLLARYLHLPSTGCIYLFSHSNVISYRTSTALNFAFLYNFVVNICFCV